VGSDCVRYLHEHGCRYKKAEIMEVLYDPRGVTDWPTFLYLIEVVKLPFRSEDVYMDEIPFGYEELQEKKQRYLLQREAAQREAAQRGPTPKRRKDG
jgi:hypothetical protein